jgi:AraC family transcriptional regulator of adaptative response/methylated-DNA-[protein]-cysteine methyltransferase
MMPSLARLAEAVGTTPHALHRAFRKALGITPKQYAVACRRGRLRGGLDGPTSITAAVFDAGYNSLGRAYSEIGAVLGMTPKRYRAGGRGERIGYAVVPSPLGRLLVAGTERGICSVTFGDSAAALVSALRSRFPQAVIERDRDLERSARHVAAAVDEGVAPDLPLDIRGTALQQKVWQVLRGIPPGSTETYTEVARRAGRPDAVRAVAGACAANTLGVLVPCHRVVRSGGGLGGYRWGIARKKALLAREAMAAEKAVSRGADAARRSRRGTPSAPRRKAAS